MRLTSESIRTGLHFWITDKQVDQWFVRTNVFFVLAIGRSGTKFLSHLLNHTAEGAVYHEPVHSDVEAYQDAFDLEKNARTYIDTFRKKEIYLRARGLPIHTYGEVNSLLRRHYKALKDAIPSARYLHLIRDGRDVVRSMLSRGTFADDNSSMMHIRPHQDDPFSQQWSEMNQLEKVCWYWQIENSYLRKNIGRTAKLELLISDYAYFVNEVLEPLDLHIPKEIWQKAVNEPKNITPVYKMPHWSHWDTETYQVFEKICGDEMRANEYTF